MLGHMAVRVLSKEHDVIGTTRSAVMETNGLSRFLESDKWIGNIDVRKLEDLTKLVNRVKPDVILNCVGLVKQKMTSLTYIESIEINALLPHRLAQICEDSNSRLIQISTDCVFGCEPGVKSQFTEPDSKDLYGRTKLLGEVTYGSALTLRTSIVGRQLSGDESLFEWIINQRNGSVNGYQNARYTGLTTQALAEVILKIISEHHHLRGLWQVASEEISKYQLVEQLNQILDLGITLRSDTEFNCDRRLDGNPFERETGIITPSWKAMLQSFAADQVNYENKEIGRP